MMSVVRFACVAGVMLGVSVGGARGISTVHSPVRRSRGPFNTSLSSSFLILTVVFEKVAVQLLSQSWPMESRFPVFSSEKTRAELAGLGMSGMESFACDVDVSTWPFGHPTEIGLADSVIMLGVCMM